MKTHDELVAELAAAEQRARDAEVLRDAERRARLRAEAREADAHRNGVKTAIEWLRDMPPFRLVAHPVKLEHMETRLVVQHVAKHLEARLVASDEPTLRVLPGADDSRT